MDHTETHAELYPDLREWLDRTGTKQIDLARLLGVSGASVTNYLSGKTPWPTEFVLRISLITGIPAERFATDETLRLLKLWGSRSTSPAPVTDDHGNVA